MTAATQHTSERKDSLITKKHVPLAIGRKRKAHHKSRRGCANCKLRRVKCDETHPRCRKCVEYGVSCDYNLENSTSNAKANKGEGLLDFSTDAPFQIVEFSLSSTDSSSESATHQSTSRSETDSNSNSPSSNGSGFLPVIPDSNESNTQLQLYKGGSGLWNQSYYDHEHIEDQQHFPGPRLGLASPTLSYTLLSMFDFNANPRSTSYTTSYKPFQPNHTTLEILDRFQSRTALSMGSTGSWEAFRSSVIRLAWSHEHLLHIVLALTLKHDKYLLRQSQISEKDKSGMRARAEAYHWYRGTHLFNRMLSRAITAKSHMDSHPAVESAEPDEHEVFFDEVRSSLWPSAALLGAIVFSDNTEQDLSTSIWDVWPLKSPKNDCDDELEWLKMSEGKHTVWELVQTPGQGSVFTNNKESQSQEIRMLMERMERDLRLAREDRFGLREVQQMNARLPNGLGELFFSPSVLATSTTFLSSNTDEPETETDSEASLLFYDCFPQCPSSTVHRRVRNLTSTANGNTSEAIDSASIYLPTLIILSYILTIPCNHSTVVPFLQFLTNSLPEFINLLRHKDPRAVFLLSLWYAKLAEYGVWWVMARAVREGQAICLWLELLAEGTWNNGRRGEPGHNQDVTSTHEGKAQDGEARVNDEARRIVDTQGRLLAWVRETCRFRQAL